MKRFCNDNSLLGSTGLLISDIVFTDLVTLEIWLDKLFILNYRLWNKIPKKFPVYVSVWQDRDITIAPKVDNKYVGIAHRIAPEDALLIIELKDIHMEIHKEINISSNGGKNV
jgi:hypothetical protein